MAPTGVTDGCGSPSGRTMTVSGNAVAGASTYTVFKSTTPAGGTSTSTVSGVSTDWWTSGTLTADNYWFKGAACVRHQVGERPVGRDPQ